MQKYTRSKFSIPCSTGSGSAARRRAGFTLLEVVMVMVLLLIISSISVPYFAGTFRGTKLRSAARTIERMARYGRNMAIIREETLTMVLNHETMELFLGAAATSTTNSADGELDQEVLKRLGYVEGDPENAASAGIDREVRRFLSDDIFVRNFEKEWTDEDFLYEDLYLVRFYPNGQCEGFLLELEDNRGHGIRLENDPISGKIRSEFLQ